MQSERWSVRKGWRSGDVFPSKSSSDAWREEEEDAGLGGNMGSVHGSVECGMMLL